MRNDYELLHPVLAIVSVGLIAYLVYLISLMVMGSAMRAVENAILVLVVIATLVIIIFIVREETRLHEKLNRVLSRAGKAGEKEAPLKPPIPEESREEIRRALRKEVLEEEKPARKPGTGKEKVDDIRKLLRLGTELAGTDTKKAREAYSEARKIYEPLSEEEKKLISKETIMMMKLYKKLEKKPR